MNISLVIYYLRRKVFLLWESTVRSYFFGESRWLDASWWPSKRPWPWILLWLPNLTPVRHPLSILYRPNWRNLICKSLLLLLPLLRMTLALLSAQGGENESHVLWGSIGPISRTVWTPMCSLTTRKLKASIRRVWSQKQWRYSRRWRRRARF